MFKAYNVHAVLYPVQWHKDSNSAKHLKNRWEHVNPWPCCSRSQSAAVQGHRVLWVGRRMTDWALTEQGTEPLLPINFPAPFSWHSCHDAIQSMLFFPPTALDNLVRTGLYVKMLQICPKSRPFIIAPTCRGSGRWWEEVVADETKHMMSLFLEF